MPAATTISAEARTSNVSISNAVCAPKRREYCSKASRSVAAASTQECAIVPDSGMPNRCPASTNDVALQPAMWAARAASSAASSPCARRAPNSITGFPAAACTDRTPLLAIDVWKLTMARSAVSTSCAWASGAVTRRTGSFGKNGVPSAIA